MGKCFLFQYNFHTLQYRKWPLEGGGSASCTLLFRYLVVIINPWGHLRSLPVCVFQRFTASEIYCHLSFQFSSEPNGLNCRAQSKKYTQSLCAKVTYVSESHYLPHCRPAVNPTCFYSESLRCHFYIQWTWILSPAPKYLCRSKCLCWARVHVASARRQSGFKKTWERRVWLNAISWNHSCTAINMSSEGFSQDRGATRGPLGFTVLDFFQRWRKKKCPNVFSSLGSASSLAKPTPSHLRWRLTASCHAAMTYAHGHPPPPSPPPPPLHPLPFWHVNRLLSTLLRTASRRCCAQPYTVTPRPVPPYWTGAPTSTPPTTPAGRKTRSGRVHPNILMFVSI